MISTWAGSAQMKALLKSRAVRLVFDKLVAAMIHPKQARQQPKFGSAENTGFALSSLAVCSVRVCLASLEPKLFDAKPCQIRK
jgi:hypothetical protein